MRDFVPSVENDEGQKVGAKTFIDLFIEKRRGKADALLTPELLRFTSP
jgi:hypothetical protein